jgi:hypothetical protein
MKLSQAEELHKPLRRFDKRFLNESSAQVRFPLKSKVSSSADKAYILLQCAVDGIAVADFFLRVEMSETVERCVRILGALTDLCVSKLHGILLESSLLLLRALKTRMWETSNILLRQCPEINDSVRKRLGEMHFNSVKDFEHYNERSFQNVISCSAKDAQIIVQFMRHCLDISLQLSTVVDPSKKAISYLTETLLPSVRSRESRLNECDYSLVSYDVLTGALLCHRRLASSRSPQTVTVQIPVSTSFTNIYTVLICDWTGFDCSDNSAALERVVNTSDGSLTASKKKRKSCKPGMPQQPASSSMDTVNSRPCDFWRPSSAVYKTTDRLDVVVLDDNEGSCAAASHQSKKRPLADNPFCKYGYREGSDSVNKPGCKDQYEALEHPRKCAGSGATKELQLMQDKAKDLKFSWPPTLFKDVVTTGCGSFGSKWGAAVKRSSREGVVRFSPSPPAAGLASKTRSSEPNIITPTPFFDSQENFRPLMFFDRADANEITAEGFDVGLGVPTFRPTQGASYVFNTTSDGEIVEDENSASGKREFRSAPQIAREVSGPLISLFPARTTLAEGQSVSPSQDLLQSYQHQSWGSQQSTLGFNCQATNGGAGSAAVRSHSLQSVGGIHETQPLPAQLNNHHHNRQRPPNRPLTGMSVHWSGTVGDSFDSSGFF